MKDLRELKISTIKSFITDLVWELREYRFGGSKYGMEFPKHAWAEQLMQDLEQRELDDIQAFQESNVSTNANND